MADINPTLRRRDQALRSILSADGIIGGKMRWWTGSKNFDFQCTETEATEQQQEVSDTRRNIEERTERLLKELSTPIKYDKQAKNDIECVERGLSFILLLGLEADNFKNFGTDMFLTFYDVATTAEEPLRKFALLRTELTAQMWLQNYPSFNSAEEPPADEILDFIMGTYALERVGIGYDSKEEIRNAAKRYTLNDFFGIKIEDLHYEPDGSEAYLQWSEYIQIIAYTFYAEKTGIDIHVSLSTVIKYLPSYRPYYRYKVSVEDDSKFDEFQGQLTMIFNVIHVLSNYGELGLPAELLPQETAFLSDAYHMNTAIALKDVHLVGELAHCLRVLGIEEDSTLIQNGLQFLRSVQCLDGSWPARDDSDDPYFRYNAAMCSISALNPQRFRGFGPSDPKLEPILRRMANCTRFKDTSSSTTSNLTVDTVGGVVKPPTLSDFKTIEVFYQSKVNRVSRELGIDAEDYGNARLKLLLETKLETLKKSHASEFRLAGQRSKKKQRKEEKEDERAWRPSSSK